MQFLPEESDVGMIDLVELYRTLRMIEYEMNLDVCHRPTPLDYARFRAATRRLYDRGEINDRHLSVLLLVAAKLNNYVDEIDQGEAFSHLLAGIFTLSESAVKITLHPDPPSHPTEDPASPEGF